MSKKSRAKRKQENERKKQALEQQNKLKQFSAPDNPAKKQNGPVAKQDFSPLKKNVEDILASFNLPGLECPETKNGITYFAEALNHREHPPEIIRKHPYVIIRAFRNYDYSKKKRGGRKEKELTLAEKYEKASERGSAVWRPTLTGDAWEVRVKGRATSGVFTKYSGIPNQEEAIKLLFQELQ